MMKTVDRRKFVRRSFELLGSAAALSLSGSDLLARGQNQNLTSPVRRPGRYDESLILERKPFKWPGGKTLAVWVIPNVEVFIFNPAQQTIGGSGTDMDVLNYSWREYGMRVGLWRIADVMDQVGARGTVALNAAVCEQYPKAIEEMKKRGWEMMGHNLTNSRDLRNSSPEQERTLIQSTLQIIEHAMGAKVRGWLGSGLNETLNTLDVLAENGVDYTGDWNNDDLPYRMKVKSGQMFAMPYGNQINDISFFGRHSGEEYFQLVVDAFDTLYADSQKLSRVMGIPLHPFHTGEPLHIKHFQKAMQYIKQRNGVWFATGSEILDAYKKAAG